MDRMLRQLGVIAGLAVVAALYSSAAHASPTQVARGKYLVTLGGCEDCHTPGHFFGKPDMNRDLGGSDVGFDNPGSASSSGRI